MDLFKDKVVWITGASSGIGEALLYRFVNLGARVVASSNQPEGLLRVKSNCGDRSSMVHIVPLDLADSDGFEKTAGQMVSEMGKIDYLINLGGVSQRATILETPLWLDRRIMEINYFGTIALSKAVLPHMIKNGGGHILATSSISGRFGFPLRSAYSASKQALHGFFETLHIENSRFNIRASVIIPGRVKTNISVNALTATGSEHGKLDPGQAKGITPEKAAQKIVKGIRRNRREILVGGSELLMLYIRKFFPSLFFNIAGKIKPE
ncbi:MAG: SDR family NAD(P)-dependent oxidoreductase [Bacteroidales bacterium]|nr:SDR family NAD(P)-dependent oxidoreductase [Bacteroidales bacterium]